jgi:hypothetical protein
VRRLCTTRICCIMKMVITKLSITKGRLATATVAIVLLVAVFIAGAQHGYDLGYTDGENKANGWWIDKKSQYYEAAKIKKKRISLKYNQI